MRVLVYDEDAGRAAVLRAALERSGCTVIVSGASPLALLAEVETRQPDVIVIDTDSPSRDVLEHVCVVSAHRPRPIVMFARDGAPDAIREAVRAGVSAYVVDALDAARVRSIVDVAVAQFDSHQALRARLAAAELRLEERKLVERAKGLLMRQRGLSEPDAYAALRKSAMSQGRRLADVARRLIELSDLIG
jgi:response regulator NasT